MDRKIDIHTHILPGIDDGATNVEESMEIIHYLYNQGITDIVLTSHYIENINYDKSFSDEKNFGHPVYANIISQNDIILLSSHRHCPW